LTNFIGRPEDAGEKMRKALISAIALCAVLTTSAAYAQGPFGGPFGPRGAFRPPMPPMPVPTVLVPAPSYVRVPGLTIVTGPRLVAPVPSYNLYRATAIVPVVIQPSYSAARVAVVQPRPSAPTNSAPNLGVYQAGRASYRAAPAPSPTSSSSTSDLRPGMVLPDGAVVVSVGPAGAPSSQPTPASSSPAPAARPFVPTPAPAALEGSNSTGEPQSILEELPRPAASDGATNPNTKQF
jgi:hypothetical protein